MNIASIRKSDIQSIHYIESEHSIFIFMKNSEHSTLNFKYFKSDDFELARDMAMVEMNQISLITENKNIFLNIKYDI